MLTSRRSFITGLATLIAAPAIVRAANIMPVKALDDPFIKFWEFGPLGEDALPEIQFWLNETQARIAQAAGISIDHFKLVTQIPLADGWVSLRAR